MQLPSGLVDPADFAMSFFAVFSKSSASFLSLYETVVGETKQKLIVGVKLNNSLLEVCVNGWTRKQLKSQFILNSYQLNFLNYANISTGITSKQLSL